MSGKRRTIVTVAAGVAVLLAMGLLTYGFSLRLPFFSDDMAHARFLQSTDLSGLWRTAWGLGYYRPLPATIWKALSLLQGRGLADPSTGDRPHPGLAPSIPGWRTTPFAPDATGFSGAGPPGALRP